MGIRKLELLPSAAKVMVRSMRALYRLFQIGSVFLQFRNCFRLRNGGADLAEHIHDIHPLVLAELPADEVEGLNAVGPLIETGDLAIPHVLLHGIFLAVSIAAVNINGLGARSAWPYRTNRPCRPGSVIQRDPAICPSLPDRLWTYPCSRR